MKKVRGWAIILFTVSLLGACAGSEVQQVITMTNLVKSDEFDIDGQLDPMMWTYDIGRGQNGWGNFELQYYTDRPENVFVQDGLLHIIARKENYEGAQFTSARIKTQGIYERTYGRFEARIQLPWGQGLWPAFWLLGANIDEVSWPQCGEIDIMEYRGQQPTIALGSIHGPGYSAGDAITKRFELKNDRFDTGFHIFGIEWGPNYINFYIDDVLYNQITPDDAPGEWVFNSPFFIIMNVAVGGTFVGAPSEATVFPQTMLVDYIRIYE